MKTKQRAYNRLPKRVSQKEFNRLIAPHLRKPIKGPEPKISYYKIFNYIMYVLSTGCQWRQLPVYRNEISWQVVYKWHRRWSLNGSYLNLLEGTVQLLQARRKLQLAHMHGDGSNTVAKKGEAKLDTPATNTRKDRKP
jgi:transposase